ncbi:prephenate dehydrogenase/arogenate dehydrogenase family protein [Microvirga sp. M2]|uniref:prephenate dehydrogenase/arogenate dehydrogenase family protein n=1 Tax=Microvirga sp. M2 TaxID=3073270 RepID=UPI0039C1D4AA
MSRPTPFPPDRPRLALIGAGAFGEFCIPHLRRFFEIRVFDPRPDLDLVCERHGVAAADLASAAGQDIVLLAVPFRHLRPVARAVAPHVKPGALVIDVCSVKVRPLAILQEELPADAEIVGTHPLFGPQSGRDGIAGLRIAVCPARGRRGALVERFLRRRLGLSAARMTAEEHDRQMAYVQGLTHLISRIVLAMDVPPLEHRTTTYAHLESMIGMVRHDSDGLFRTILADNPFAGAVMQSFTNATRDVLQPFGYPANGSAL